MYVYFLSFFFTCLFCKGGRDEGAFRWYEERRRGVFSLLSFVHDGVCYVIGYIKDFIPKSLSSQFFHADESRQVFLLRASVLGLISSMRLDEREDIQSVKLARSVLHAELKSCVVNLNRGLIKDVKRTHMELFSENN